MDRDTRTPLTGDVYIGGGIGARTQCGKFAYATIAAAEAAARHTRPDRGDPSDWPHPYACDRCGWFHVGHLPQPVRDGLCTRDEWFAPVGPGAAMRHHTIAFLKAHGVAPLWTRVGEAWRATVEIAGRAVSSKPSRNPNTAAEDLIRRIRRVPRKETATP